MQNNYNNNYNNNQMGYNIINNNDFNQNVGGNFTNININNNSDISNYLKSESKIQLYHKMKEDNKLKNNNIQFLEKGDGINNNEKEIIILCVIDSLNKEEDPLSKSIIGKLKKFIEGEWVVFAYVDGLKGYDLSVSVDDGNNLLSLVVDNFWFQIIKIS